MRVGVDLRILAVGRAASTRGMPRFTQQQLREVLARDHENEYLVFLTPKTEPALVLPEILAAENLSVRFVPHEVAERPAGAEEQRRKAALFQAWLAAQDLDLFHATTPFYLDELVVAGVDACPMVATLYDLIPMIYPAHYLLDDRTAGDYVRAAGLVAGARRVLAISESARRDGNLYLGVARDAIDMAWPIAEPFFRPMTSDDAGAALGRLERDMGLPRSFILAVPHLHFSKNIEGLLRAYALVPPAVRAHAPLVMTCHFAPHGEARVRRLARLLRISDDLVITGMVVDAELAALYNRALFVVHPSRHEGFGLPVLEAMQCGSAVITSTSSSLPEVAGDATLLVDHDDAPALADAIVSLFEDAPQREELAQRGLARAAIFGPDQLAGATLRSYRQAVSGEGAGGGDDRHSDRVKVGLSKACEPEDFDDPGVSAALADLGVVGRPGRRAWRQAMAVHALRSSGAGVPGASVLVTDDDSAAIAGCLGERVAVATSPPGWDGSRLPFDDDAFDAVISCGALRYLEGVEEVAGAAYEMARVLKPGGVLSVGTDMVVAGPPGGTGAPGSLLFPGEVLQRYLVDASGLEPIDGTQLAISPATVSSARDMDPLRLGRSGAGRPPRPERADDARLLQVRDGCVVGAVHLALRKAESQPAIPNDWAQPPAVGRRPDRVRSATSQAIDPGPAPLLPLIADRRHQVEAMVSQVMGWQADVDGALRGVEEMLTEVSAGVGRLADLVPS